MFFYGTLKRGRANHDLFCRGALRSEGAVVRGRLYDLPQGYPALEVPRADARLSGTADPHHDVREQRRLNERGRVEHPGGPLVHGELHFFDDPEQAPPWTRWRVSRPPGRASTCAS